MPEIKTKNIVDNVIFFDGYCPLCNGLVSFIFSLRAGKNFKYAPLDGQTAKELLVNINPRIDSIVLYRKGEIVIESEAALGIAKQLNWPYKAFYYLKVFPKSLRNMIYRWVARNRFKVFARKQECRIPTKEERACFLP